MANNLVSKLGVDPSKYVSGMDQARKSLDSFQKQNLSNKAAMKEVTSVLIKYVSVAALVKGAQEVLTRTMQGSQTTADGWAATVDGCKNAVDTFFTALSKGDFSSFAQGLDVIISKGRAASVAMDQLGNTIMSFNYLSASNNATFAQSLLTIRDTKATASERGAAVKAAEDELNFMTDLVAGKQATLYNAIAAVSTKKSPLAANQFNFEDIKAISLLDAFADVPEKLREYGLETKDYYLNLAKEYAEKIKAAQPKYETYDGNLARSEQGRAQIAEIEKRNAEKRAAFNAYNEQLKEQYLFALEVQALLEDIKDEDLQNIFNLFAQISDAEMQLTNMTKQLMQAKGEYKRGLPTSEEAPRTFGTLPGPSNPFQNLDVATKVVDKLPEMERTLTEVNGVLYDMNGNVIAVTNSFDRMTAAADGVNSIGRAMESLGSTFGQLEGPGWKMAGGVMATAGAVVQAYTQMAQAASIAATAQAATETPTVWGKIAAITTMLGAFAAMVSTVQSSVRTYADGGVIPGQNYNDGITARVSSGEMIINPADQKRLFDFIHTGGIGGGSGSAAVTGEQIVIAVNNYARRTNRGELVFAGRG